MNSSQEQKAPPSMEQSLKYMAWDVKTIGQEIKALNVTIQALTAMIGRHFNEKGLPPKSGNDIPF